MGISKGTPTGIPEDVMIDAEAEEAAKLFILIRECKIKNTISLVCSGVQQCA